MYGHACPKCNGECGWHVRLNPLADMLLGPAEASRWLLRGNRMTTLQVGQVRVLANCWLGRM